MNDDVTRLSYSEIGYKTKHCYIDWVHRRGKGKEKGRNNDCEMKKRSAPDRMLFLERQSGDDTLKNYQTMCLKIATCDLIKLNFYC